jgi:hypothetical protein
VTEPSVRQQLGSTRRAGRHGRQNRALKA